MITNLEEKQLMHVELSVVDIIPKLKYLTDLDDVSVDNPSNGELLTYNSTTGKWENKPISESEIVLFVYNEVPTLLSGSTYQVLNKYRSNTLRVFVNGLKQITTDITTDANNKKFTLAFTLEGTDLIECHYIKQS
jgi:hypothetical protein